MRISELVQYGLDKRAIDYYTNTGLIPCSEDSKEPNSRYRNYGDDAVIAVKKIAILREVGLTMKEIREHMDDPSYFTTEMWNKHIAELEKKKDELTERYNRMIEYATDLRDSKSLALNVVEEIANARESRLISKVLSTIVNTTMKKVSEIEQMGDRFLEQSDDETDDVQLLYLKIYRFFNKLFECFKAGAPYDSDKVQGLIVKYGSSLMESFGTLVYYVYDTFKDIAVKEFRIFDGMEPEMVDFLKKVVPMCVDWYKETQTLDRALDYDRFYEKHQDQIREIDSMVGESTFDFIKYILLVISKTPQLLVGCFAEAFKDKEWVEKSKKGFDLGATLFDDSNDLPEKERKEFEAFTQYQKNAMYYFFEQKAKDLPENWLQELGLDFNEEEGE